MSAYRASEYGAVQGMTKEQFMTAMSVDKKVENGKLRLVLLKGELGGCIVTDKFALSALDETLSAFCPS
jgi:3-dehydroquinate synthase